LPASEGFVAPKRRAGYDRRAISLKKSSRMKILFALIAAGLLLGCNNNPTDAGEKASARSRPKPAASARPATPTQIVNGDFEQTAGDGSIPGWSQTQHAGPKSYDMRIDPEGAYQGKGSFHMTRTREQVYGALTQDLDLSAYAGKTVELSAMLKTRGVGPGGWMIMLNAPGLAKNSAQMTGDTDWQRQSISARLPANARHVVVGATLNDAGEGWMDDLQLKVVD